MSLDITGTDPEQIAVRIPPETILTFLGGGDVKIRRILASHGLGHILSSMS
jgi:hypothetical protein